MGQLKFSNFAEKKKGQKDSKKYEFIDGIYINTHIQYITYMYSCMCVYTLLHAKKRKST